MDYICTSCNYVGPQKLVKPGSNLVEMLLWAVLLVPGPFYSIWRVINKHYACPVCGEKVMVPAVRDIAKKDVWKIKDELAQKDNPQKISVAEIEKSVVAMEEKLAENNIQKPVVDIPPAEGKEDGSKSEW